MRWNRGTGILAAHARNLVAAMVLQNVVEYQTTQRLFVQCQTTSKEALCTIREKQLGIYATKNYGGHSGGKKGPTLIQMACEKCYRHIFLWKCAVALVITISFIRCLDRHELRWWEWRLFPDMRFLKLYKLSTLQSSLTHKPDRTSKRRPVLTVNYQNITLPRTPSPV